MEPDTIANSRFRNQIEIDRSALPFELNQPDAVIVLVVLLDDPANGPAAHTLSSFPLTMILKTAHAIGDAERLQYFG
jgi:hypothetical protein